jgi:hypothetical protein
MYSRATLMPVVARRQDPRKIFLSWIPDGLARGRTDYDTFLKADRRESARDLSNSEGVLPEDGERAFLQ